MGTLIIGWLLGVVVAILFGVAAMKMSKAGKYDNGTFYLVGFIGGTLSVAVILLFWQINLFGHRVW